MQLSFRFQDFFRNRSNEEKDSPDGEIPTFLVQGGIVGDVTVQCPGSAQLDTGLRLEVNLEGYARTELDTCVDSRSEYRMTVEKRILSMTQALSVDRYDRSGAQNERHYPFSFDVQSWMRHTEINNPGRTAMNERNHFSQLPPSLRHEVLSTPLGAPRPRAGARVTYRLLARLIKDGKAIRSKIQPVLLLLAQDVSPPLCISDFKGEYCTVAKAAMKGPLRQNLGEVSMIVKEPEQLSIRAKSADSMVKVPVVLRIQKPGLDVAASNKFCIEADVKWHFCFSTFVSMLEQKGPATLNQAMMSPATAHVKSSLKTRLLRATWKDWRQSSKRVGTIECEQSLWLRFPRSEVLTPTFWSTYLSRRYSIWLQVKVASPGSAKLEVEVPVQVGIESESRQAYEQILQSRQRHRCDASFDDAEGDELLPVYVR